MTVSLLTAVNSASHVHLILGTNPLANARCAKSLEVGAIPVVIAAETSEVHYGLQKRFDSGEVKWLKRKFEDQDLSTLGREEVEGFVDAVFVTGSRDPLATHISTLCKRLRIPVNVVDSPQLCTFTLLSTYTDGPLQVGVTTNGKGCKLSSRIRREIAASLPNNLGSACERFGTIRKRIQAEDHLTHLAISDPLALDDEDSLDQSSSFNTLITEADLDAAKSRRLRWLSQICEYWPLSRLASVTDVDVETVLRSYAADPHGTASPLDSSTIESRAALLKKRGRIILAGSGPGHPDLLTRATHKAILAADLVLADKLVPAGVLDLIPRRTPVQIARKFPGNAEQAQTELLEMGLAGLRAGKTVLRLKQGDPYVYGRGGEEFDFFRKEGFGDRITVLPGMTSALSAPLFSEIPSTHRGVSDQVLICTGTGRKGAPTVPPEFVSTRTVVFLMALHRITGLVQDLTTYGPETAIPEGATPKEDKDVDKSRRLWPSNTPCAVVERASCPDQRIIRTTLEFVAAAIEEEGSRPPGLLVLGKACEILHKAEPARKWIVEDGFKGLDDFGDIPGLEQMMSGWGQSSKEAGEAA